ncbi:MAG: hypothetical protein ACI9DJ_001679 [Algoriphagus sp.]|jgi:hypothetical protein
MSDGKIKSLPFFMEEIEVEVLGYVDPKSRKINTPIKKS